MRVIPNIKKFLSSLNQKIGYYKVDLVNLSLTKKEGILKKKTCYKQHKY